MTTKEMNQRTLFLIKNIIENRFNLINSPNDYEEYSFDTWQALAEINGILVALNEFCEKDIDEKKISYKSVTTETANQTVERLANDIAVAIKRYNSMLHMSDGRRIDECKTVNDEYIYEFVR